MARLSDLIRSSALSVADFMARWGKACSEAAALSSAAYRRAYGCAAAGGVEDGLIGSA